MINSGFPTRLSGADIFLSVSHSFWRRISHSLFYIHFGAVFFLSLSFKYVSAPKFFLSDSLWRDQLFTAWRSGREGRETSEIRRKKEKSKKGGSEGQERGDGRREQTATQKT